MEISRIEQSMHALFVEIGNLLTLEAHFDESEKTVIQECSIRLNKLLLAKLNALGKNETTLMGGHG
ncbi:MAG: hypothetical protein HKM04_09200 [Legionellales bacterium]|nr:hypothetical protein [Legionellales bacterium]